MARFRKKTPRLANTLAPPNRLKSTKVSRTKKILIAILIAIIIAGLSTFIFLTDFFKVKDFQIIEEGTIITTNLHLNEIISGELQNRNLLIFQSRDLRDKILATYPEYESIQIVRHYPDQLDIVLEKYPLSANIINAIVSPDGLRVQKKYLVNTNGLIVKENEDNHELPYVELSSDQALELGDQAMDADHLDYILNTIKLFEEKIGIQVIDSSYLRKAREVHLRTEKGFTVWFDINYNTSKNNMIEQIDKLKKALPKLDVYNTPLEYIDLRISGTNAEKVIFKPL